MPTWSTNCSFLLVAKLSKDNHCVALFHPDFCLIQDLLTRKITGVGKEKRGTYHVLDVSEDKLDEENIGLILNLLSSARSNVDNS